MTFVTQLFVRTNKSLNLGRS